MLDFLKAFFLQNATYGFEKKRPCIMFLSEFSQDYVAKISGNFTRDIDIFFQKATCQSHLFVECGNRTLKIFPLSSMSKYFPIWHLKGHLYGYYFSRFNILSAITNGLVLPSPFGCHFPKPLRKNDNYCHSQKGAMLQN